MDEIMAYQIETWIEYAFCTTVMALRLFVRIRIRGRKGLDWDDYLMGLAFATVTVMSAAAHMVSTYGHNKVPGIGEASNPARLKLVTENPELAEQLATGSKFFLVGWFMYPGFVWTLKLCMVFFLRRLVAGIWVEKFIIPMMVLVCTCYVIIIIVVTTSCRPFYKYWQIYPDPGYNCYPDTLGLYVAVLVMNLFTDTCLVLIPLPIIRRASMSFWKMVGLGVLLSAGVFIMVAAILRVYMSITSPSGATPAFWACREATVACFVVNAPLLIPLFKKEFWTGELSESSTYNYNSREGNPAHIKLPERKDRKKFRHPTDMETYIKDRTIVDVESSSTEYINRPSDSNIHVKRDVVIDSFANWNDPNIEPIPNRGFNG